MEGVASCQKLRENLNQSLILLPIFPLMIYLLESTIFIPKDHIYFKRMSKLMRSRKKN